MRHPVAALPSQFNQSPIHHTNPVHRTEGIRATRTNPTGLRATRLLSTLFVCLLAACKPSGEEQEPQALASFTIDGPQLRAKLQAAVQLEGQEFAGRDIDDALGQNSIGGSDWKGDPTRRPVTSAKYAAIDDQLWSEEVFCLELTAQQLQSLRHLLTGREGSEKFLPQIFTAQARLQSPALALEGALELGHGVTQSTWRDVSTNGEALGLEPGPWLSEVQAWRASFARLRFVKLTPAGVRFSADGRSASVEIQWIVNGELPAGGLREDRGLWSSEWIATAEAGEDRASSAGWQCESLESRAGHSLISQAPAFVDRTLEWFEGTSLDPRRALGVSGFNRALALADLDGDQDMDLVCTLPIRVFENDGGRFVERTTEWGLREDGGTYGVLAADFDLDGDQDLVFSAKRKHCIYYEQRAPGDFVAQPILASHDNSLPSSLSAHDVDGDGYLDIYVCGYGAFINPGPNSPSNATNGRPNQLLRGLGNGQFEDATAAWGLDGENTRWSFIGAFGDADEDGDIDLYVANDFGPNILYRAAEPGPDGRPRFTAEVETDIDPGYSMSAAWFDLDGDSDLDMYVSNMEAIEAERMIASQGHLADAGELRAVRERMSKGNTPVFNRTLDDGTRVLVEGEMERGARAGAWAWGTAMLDLDCDGDLDIQCVNGFLSHGVDDGRDWDSVWWRHGLRALAAGEDWDRTYAQFTLNSEYGWSWAGHQRSAFFSNDGRGNFQEMAGVLGLDQVSDGRGLAMGDLDGDGDFDLVGTSATPPHLYVLRNDSSPAGHFMVIDPIPALGHSAAGTKLIVQAGGSSFRRDVALGWGFLSQHELAQHFGLGQSSSPANLEITWPDGSVDNYEDLPLDARLRITQNVGVERIELSSTKSAAQARVAPIEWAEYKQRIQPTRERRLKFVDFLPLVDAEGQRVLFDGRRPRHTLVVLFDPGSAATRSELARLPDILAEHSEELGLQLGCLDADVDLQALREEMDGLGLGEVPLARLQNSDQRAAIEAMLARWFGNHGLPAPLSIFYDRKGRVEALVPWALEPDDIRLFLNN